MGEGPIEYLLRLANANGLTLRDFRRLGVIGGQHPLKEFARISIRSEDPHLNSYVGSLRDSILNTLGVWNLRRMRFCPMCISQEPTWLMEWEHLLCEACPRHGCWLIDRCCRCHAAITAKRDRTDHCNCGQALAGSSFEYAPSDVLALVSDLHQKINGRLDGHNLTVLDGLTLDQALSLIRFLGGYGAADTQMKVPTAWKASLMEHSVEIVSVAATVLANWPGSFHDMLHRISQRNCEGPESRLPKQFGAFYAAMYRRFAEDQFAFVRDTFEQYVAHHWTRPLARRNKRLSAQAQTQATWIPRNQACSKLSISRSRLHELVRGGQLVGTLVRSDKGRSFMAVHRASVDALLPKLSDEVDLKTACVMLGLTKSRLLSTLPIFLPEARKVEGASGIWAISRRAIQECLGRSEVPIIPAVDKEQVSFSHVTRFWNYTNEEIASVLLALRTGKLKPIGRIGKAVAVGGLVFNVEDLRNLINKQRHSATETWTVPQVATLLSIKQEVAYSLVKYKILVSERRSIGFRTAEMITRQALDEFQCKYVFARDLAGAEKTTSRALNRRLSVLGIRSATDHFSRPCRQLIYQWTPTLRALFPQKSMGDIISSDMNVSCQHSDSSSPRSLI